MQLFQHFAYMGLFLLLAAACTKEQSIEPDIPQPPEKPFEILFPKIPVAHDRRLPLVMTWKVNDSTISKVRIYYRPTDTDKWFHEVTITANLGRFEFSTAVFDQKKYIFALSTEDGTYWDSSGVVSLDWSPVALTQPRAGELRLSSDVNLFKWVCFDDRIQRVEVVWRPAESSVWKAGWSLMAADSSMDWIVVPWTSGTILDFAIRGVYYIDAGLAPTEWSIVHNVAFGELTVTSPLQGSEWYRYMPAKILASVIVPSAFGKASEAVYELSTDGGATWEATALEWTVLQSATTQAFVRVRHEGMKRTIVSGPFSIVDRSSEYFSLYPGQEFRYFHFHYSGGFGGPIDTTGREWLTITVLNMVQTSERKEYACSVRLEKSDGSTTTSNELLWQELNGQQLISGNFMPFVECHIFGIHDVMFDIYRKVNSASPPGVIPAYSTGYWTRKGKGLVSWDYDYTAARQPPVHSCERYILLE